MVRTLSGIKLKSSLIMFDLFLFLFLYQPTIFGLNSVYYIPIFIVAYLSICGFRLRYFIDYKYAMYLKKILILIGFAIIYLLLMGCDFSVEKKTILLIIPVIEFWFVIQFKTIHNYSNEQILSEVIKIGLLQTLFCVIMIIIPEFREIQINYVSKYVDETISTASIEGIRMFGIAGYDQYFYSIGMVHGLMSILVFYKGLKVNSIRYMLMSLVLLIPSMLNARTGAIVSVIIMFIMMLVFFVKNKSINSYMLRGFVFIIILVSGLIMLSQKVVEKAYNWWVELFEVIKDLITHNSYSQALNWYGGIIPSNWILPDKFNLIIGVGAIPVDKFSNVVKGGAFDSGYVRVIWTGGLVLMALVLIGYCFIVYNSKCDKLLRISIFGFMVFGTLKGNLYSSLSVLLLVMLIIFFAEGKRTDYLSKKDLVKYY